MSNKIEFAPTTFKYFINITGFLFKKQIQQLIVLANCFFAVLELSIVVWHFFCISLLREFLFYSLQRVLYRRKQNYL